MQFSFRPFRIALAGLTATLSACGGSPATQLSGAPRGAASVEAAPADMGPREQTADQQVNHVLSRLTFGARPGDAESVRTMGVDKWIAVQLHPERIDDSKSDAYFAPLESYHTDADELQRKYPAPNQLLQRLVVTGFRHALPRLFLDHAHAVSFKRIRLLEQLAVLVLNDHGKSWDVVGFLAG